MYFFCIFRSTGEKLISEVGITQTYASMEANKTETIQSIINKLNTASEVEGNLQAIQNRLQGMLNLNITKKKNTNWFPLKHYLAIQCSWRNYLICIMSWQIHVPKTKSISKKDSRESPENWISAKGNNSRKSRSSVTKLILDL